MLKVILQDALHCFFYVNVRESMHVDIILTYIHTLFSYKILYVYVRVLVSLNGCILRGIKVRVILY